MLLKSEARHRARAQSASPVAISDIPEQDGPRIPLTDSELSRVLGGGLVPGSITLIGGEPGIGKSTLLLQTALRNPHFKTLYVSGEESEHQVRMRAERLQNSNGQAPSPQASASSLRRRTRRTSSSTSKAFVPHWW